MVGRGHPGDWRGGCSLWGVVRQARASAHARGLPLGTVLGGIEDDGANASLGPRSLGASGRPSPSALRRASFSRGRGASSIVESVIEEGDEEAEAAAVEALDRAQERRRERYGASAIDPPSTPSREVSAALGAESSGDARGGGDRSGSESWGAGSRNAHRDGGKEGRRAASEKTDRVESSPGSDRRNSVISLRFRGSSDSDGSSDADGHGDGSSTPSSSSTLDEPSGSLDSSCSSSSSSTSASSSSSSPSISSSSSSSSISRSASPACVFLPSSTLKAALEQSGQTEPDADKPLARGTSVKTASNDASDATADGHAEANLVASFQSADDEEMPSHQALTTSSGPSQFSPSPAPSGGGSSTADAIAERSEDELGIRTQADGTVPRRIDDEVANVAEATEGDAHDGGLTEASAVALPTPTLASSVSPRSSTGPSTDQSTARGASGTTNRASTTTSSSSSGTTMRSFSFASAARSFQSSVSSAATTPLRGGPALARSASMSLARTRPGMPIGNASLPRAATARVVGNRPAFGSSTVDEVRSGSASRRTPTATARRPSSSSRQPSTTKPASPSRQLSRSASRSISQGERSATLERLEDPPADQRQRSVSHCSGAADGENRRAGSRAECSVATAFGSTVIQSRESSRRRSDGCTDASQERIESRRASGALAGTSRAPSAETKDGETKRDGARYQTKNDNAAEQSEEIDRDVFERTSRGTSAPIAARSGATAPEEVDAEIESTLGNSGMPVDQDAASSGLKEPALPQTDRSTSSSLSVEPEVSQEPSTVGPLAQPSPTLVAVPKDADPLPGLQSPADPAPSGLNAPCGVPDASCAPADGDSPTPGSSELSATPRDDLSTPHLSAPDAPPPASEKDGKRDSKHRTRRHGHHRSRCKHLSDRGEKAETHGKEAIGGGASSTSRPTSPQLSSNVALVCSRCGYTVVPQEGGIEQIREQQQEQPVEPPELHSLRSHCPTCGVAIARRKRLPPPPTPPASLAALARAVGAAPRLEPPGVAPPPSLGDFLRACGLRANIGDVKPEGEAGAGIWAPKEGEHPGQGKVEAANDAKRKAAIDAKTSGEQTVTQKGQMPAATASPPPPGVAKPPRTPARPTPATASAASLGASALAASSTAPALLLSFGAAKAAHRLGIPTAFLGVSRRSADGPTQGVAPPAACEAPRLSLPKLAQGAGRTLEMLKAGKGHASAARALEMWEREIREAAGGDSGTRGAGEGGGGGAATKGRRVAFAPEPPKKDGSKARKGAGKEREGDKRGGGNNENTAKQDATGEDKKKAEEAQGIVAEGDGNARSARGASDGRASDDRPLKATRGSPDLVASAAPKDAPSGKGVAKRGGRPPMPQPGRFQSAPTSRGSTPQASARGAPPTEMAAIRSVPATRAVMPGEEPSGANTPRAKRTTAAGLFAQASVGAPSRVQDAEDVGGLRRPCIDGSARMVDRPTLPETSSPGIPCKPLPSALPANNVSSTTPPLAKDSSAAALPPACSHPGQLPRMPQIVSRENDARIAAAAAVLAGLLSASTRDCPALFDAASLAWSVTIGSLSSVIESETRARQRAEGRLAAAEAAALAARRAARGCAAALERAMRAEAEVERLRGAIERIEGPRAGRTTTAGRAGDNARTAEDEKRRADGKEHGGA